MLHGRTLSRAALVLALALWASPAAAGLGSSCTPGSTGGWSADSNGNNWYCNGNTDTVTTPAYQFSSTSTGCGSGTAGTVQWTGSVLEYCSGSAWTSVNTATTTYDLAIFYPGTIGASAFARVVSARVATYPTGLTGSYCVAKEGATSSATVTLNQIHAGSSSSVGTVVFGSGGGTNVTNCTFTASSGISLAAGDALEFAFPSTPDATLGDVAITLAGTHQ
jgi:hypothetical protein